MKNIVERHKEQKMPKDFTDWMKTGRRVAIDPAQPPDLLRPLEELEAELDERRRNLYPSDASIPRGRWPEEVERILSTIRLPDEYVGSPVWRGAHELYWQVRAMKGDPNAILWHPV